MEKTVFIQLSIEELKQIIKDCVNECLINGQQEPADNPIDEETNRAKLAWQKAILEILLRSRRNGNKIPMG